MRLECHGALDASVGDDSLADARQQGNEEGEDAHVRYVEESVRHGHVASGGLSGKGVPFRADVHKMEERGGVRAGAVGEHQRERAHEDGGSQYVEQCMGEGRAPRVGVRSYGCERGGNRGADVISKHDRDGRPDVDESGFGQRDGDADCRT